VADPVFACPVCAQPLSRDGAAVRCPRSHTFDLAREGYVNLLLAQHRSSKDPGYSKEMIAGRRDFFDAGHYEPLADDVARLVVEQLPEAPSRVVLDAGCGEGYYLRRLGRELGRRGEEPSTLRCGLDISKHGIRVAARRDPDGRYAVASSHRMPVLANSVDVLLTHFSPVSAVDFARVVRPGGVVVVGGPGAGHLYSFKQLLYDQPAEHEPAEHFAADPAFELVQTSHSRHLMRLQGSQAVANLLGMTPFFWTLNAAARARLGRVESLDTEIDVVLRCYRRTSAESEPPAESEQPAESELPAESAPRPGPRGDGP
jgi:23S rRNA (guanine745-N1)-methyltransferase